MDAVPIRLIPDGFSDSPTSPRSSATCAGAHRTDSPYKGAHGHSKRLEGLDPTNSNAMSRAIVVHGADYVNEKMIGHSGMLGRSQGCFAVAHSSLPEIIARLGPQFSHR